MVKNILFRKSLPAINWVTYVKPPLEEYFIVVKCFKYLGAGCKLLKQRYSNQVRSQNIFNGPAPASFSAFPTNKIFFAPYGTRTV